VRVQQRYGTVAGAVSPVRATAYAGRESPMFGVGN
jgi:hypothetical protein